MICPWCKGRGETFVMYRDPTCRVCKGVGEVEEEIELSDEKIIAAVRQLGSVQIQRAIVELVEAHRNGRPPDGGFSAIRRLQKELLK